MVHFPWSWTRSDTFTLFEDAPQNRLRNGWMVVEVSELLYSCSCHMLTNYSITYHGLFCVILDSFGYLHTPWRRSTKSFMKRLSRCRGKEASIFMFFAISSPTAQSCTMVRFAWYWTRSDTFRLREDVPQNRSRNGQAVVEVGIFYICVFCHKLTNCSVIYYGPSSVILDSFGYLRTPWRRSTKPFRKRSSRCRGMWTCIVCFLP